MKTATRGIAIFLALIIVIGSTTAQLRNNYWMWAQYQAYQFFPNGPVPVQQLQLSGNPQNSAAISDPQGHLRLAVYNDGIRNGQYQIIAGTESLWGLMSIDGCLVVPRPLDTCLYEVFYRAIGNNPDVCRTKHVTIDVCANGGAGAVVDGSLFSFGDSLNLGITGTPHANGIDYWLVTHKWDTDEFQSFRVTELGLDTVPVRSHAGSVHSMFPGNVTVPWNNSGEIMMSAQGDRLATVLYGTLGSFANDTLPAIVDIVNFDASNGLASSFVSLPHLWKCAYAELSPDGSKFYLKNGDTTEVGIYQYDLSSGDPATIIDTRYTLGTFTGIDAQLAMGFRQGPDGMVYMTYGIGTNSMSLSRIEHPDSAGAACQPNWGCIDAGPFGANPTFPNMLKRYNDSELALALSDETATANGLNVWPVPSDGELWIQLPKGRIATRFRIADATGREVSERMASPFTMQGLDLDGLMDGCYVLTAFDRDGPISSAKLILQR